MPTNIQLWQLAENGTLQKGTIIEDQSGNQMIFTGKSFQVYYTDSDKYVGFCVGDQWGIIDIDPNELTE